MDTDPRVAVTATVTIVRRKTLIETLKELRASISRLLRGTPCGVLSRSRSRPGKKPRRR
jgi:hypothetical protein